MEDPDDVPFLPDRRPASAVLGTPRELWSPNWAGTWMGEADWAAPNLGRCVVLHNDRVIGFCDSTRDAQATLLRQFGPGDRIAVVELTVDDLPGKQYVYVPFDEKVVYYALGTRTDTIKIGTTKKIGSRLCELPQMDHGRWRLLAIERGSYELEARRHDDFSCYWINPTRRGEGRELFRPGPGLIAHMKRLAAQPPRYYPRADTLRSSRVVLDRELPPISYRPRLDVHIDQALMANLEAVAEELGESLDDLVERVLAAHVPPAREKTPPLPRPAKGESERAILDRLLAQRAQRTADHED